MRDSQYILRDLSLANNISLKFRENDKWIKDTHPQTERQEANTVSGAAPHHAHLQEEPNISLNGDKKT